MTATVLQPAEKGVLFVARKRANSEGSIYYHKGRKCWVAQVTIGKTPAGNSKRKTFYGKTQDEVLEKKQQFEAGMRASEDQVLSVANTGEPVNNSGRSMTIDQLLDLWLDSLDCEYKTLQGYKSMANNHIRPSLGNNLVSEVTPLSIQLLYNSKKKTKLSPRTIEYIHRTLFGALQQAVNWEIIAKNPADKVKKPKGTRMVKPQALTEEECKLLLDVAKDDWYYPVYVTALQTGMRMGELFGLYWEDVNLEKNIIMVRRAAKRIEGGMGIGEPKSEAGRRAISIPARVTALLQAHREKQREDSGNIDLVFANKSGTMICPSHFRRDSWYPLREKAHEHEDNKDENGKKKTDFKSLRFHDLRHTHATLLIMAGVPLKVVQSRLGHSSIKVTADTYGHLLPGADEQVVNVLDDIFDQQ